jgi:hypothetical protein
MPEIASQRPAPASLTRGNISDFHRPGKTSQETSNSELQLRINMPIMRGFGPGACGRDILKCLPGPRQNGGRAGRSFEPPQDHIAVGRVIFE